jgi:hypothetical protein
MNDYGRLASTGAPTLALAGLAINQWWLAGLALVILVIGVVALRLLWRRGKGVDQP